MAKRKTIKQEYKQQRKRVEHLVQQLSERGYYNIENIVPPEPKKITRASVRRLKKITVQSIAKQAVYAGAETFGEEVSGAKGLRLERARSAKKGQQTKAKNKQLAARLKEYNDIISKSVKSLRSELEADWESKRRTQDEQELSRHATDQSYREQFEEGTFLLDKVQQLIDNASKGQQHAAQQMQSILDNAIGTLGREQVARNIATADEDIISETQDTLQYKPASTGYANHIGTFKRILTHESPTAEEYQDWMYGREQDEYVDDQDNWYDYDDFGETTTADFD